MIKWVGDEIMKAASWKTTFAGLKRLHGAVKWACSRHQVPRGALAQQGGGGCRRFMVP
jgi:hypothetical protein